MALPTTTERVVLHTAPWQNDRINQEMERRLWYYLDHPEEIALRLRELDAEWDMERTLETNAAAAALTGFGLGAVVRPRFYILPALVMGFLLQHALQGWCPPVPVFRRLGFRTQSEIELERYTLKALRGDFTGLGPPVPVPREHRDLPTEGAGRRQETPVAVDCREGHWLTSLSLPGGRCSDYLILVSGVHLSESRHGKTSGGSGTSDIHR